MKKFMVLFTALMFLATFSLIGCNQSQPPAKPAAGKRRERSTRDTRSARSARSARSTCARKKIDAACRGIASPRGYTP